VRALTGSLRRHSDIEASKRGSQHLSGLFGIEAPAEAHLVSLFITSAHE
jgi:hypothetical protein